MIQQLRQIPLFKGLEADELNTLLARIPHHIKQYKKGVLIAMSGEVVGRQLILVQGTVKGEMYDFSGKAIKIEDIESPRLLAPAFLFGKQNTYPVNITSNTAVTILIFLKTDFIQLLQEHHVVLTNYLDSISNRAQFLSSKLRFLSFQSIKGKVAHLLLELARKHRSFDVVLPASQNDLAELFGVTRPSLARVLAELNEHHIISSRGRYVKIQDQDTLSGFLKA